MSNLPVYTHVEKISIPSSHGKDVNYLVCYGYVDWKRNGNIRPAIYVLMEYRGKISYETPPHITTDRNDDGTTDSDKVFGAIDQLKVKHIL
ncbi:hypothetical protein PMSD_17220 [Paenibacillus macquariensis subsp. defensor]|nr:hypothetical protein PMSD_17220 [Paenibacillus macquariensis subsp. defensor]